MERKREEHGGAVEPFEFDNPYHWISDEIPF
jgi:hypothetical protein